MHLLDLFSGIGGFSLGLERSGVFKTVAFCEIEPYYQKVLAKHWPQVPIYDDVKTITADRLASDGIAVDAICGGFPCQDISTAGKKAGLDGERSSLWFEYARIVGELRPRYVIVENVSALLNGGLDRVLRTLAEVGYDAEWHCIPATFVGAPHRRDRLWIVAYPTRVGLQRCGKTRCGEKGEGARIFTKSSRSSSGIGMWWRPEPDVGRVVDGLPNRSHRIKALGNAVVPQIPELIGRAIAAREAA